MRAVVGFGFDPCPLDTKPKPLTGGRARVEWSLHQHDIVHLVVSRADEVLASGVLIHAG